MTAAQTSSGIMTLAVVGLVIPAACECQDRVRGSSDKSLTLRFYDRQTTRPTRDLPKTAVLMLRPRNSLLARLRRTPTTSKDCSFSVEEPPSSCSAFTFSTSTFRLVNLRTLSISDTVSLTSVLQLKTHASLFEADAQAARTNDDGEVEEEEKAEMDAYSAFAWLAIVTVVTAICADVLVASIDETAAKWNLPKA